jgi:hypothetical protein
VGAGDPQSERRHPEGHRHDVSAFLPQRGIDVLRSPTLILRVLPAGLSLFVLAAHFFRGDAVVVAALLVAAVALLAVPRWWAARLVQVVLLLGAVEWVMTLVHLAFWRAAAGQPIVRLVVILGTVAAATAASAFALQSERLRTFYGLGRRRAAPRA